MALFDLKEVFCLASRLFFAVNILLLQLTQNLVEGREFVYAINAGGQEHVDVHGIRYAADPLREQGVGIESDFGKRLIIQRVPSEDLPLYQTERYSESSFSYDVPLRKSGKYVLILKFCEVYFQSASQKVFDVAVNDVPVVSDLDIFARVGYGTAHDEYVPLEISDDGKLSVADQRLTYDGTLRIQFQKGYYDNPKVNAILIIKGTMEDAPRLPSIVKADEAAADAALEEEAAGAGAAAGGGSSGKGRPPKKTSGPRAQNPYETDHGSLMMPIVVAIGAFIPLLFCLCKL